MSKLAIIGGSAIPQLKSFVVKKQERIETPYGETSAPLLHGVYAGRDIIFLYRHGEGRTTAPHKINYRANIWALKNNQVDNVISLALVGGIRADMTPGHFVFPDQLIDYTHGRPSTFFENDFNISRHLDFNYPYSTALHKVFVNAAQKLNLAYSDDAIYGVVQGPRFETIAEVNRLEKDGCDIIGMTAMPEAVLAAELEMNYASIAIVGTKVAGRSDGVRVDIDEMNRVIDGSMEKMYELLSSVVNSI